MVKLRLTRMGRHKSPFYRIVAMDARAKANGAYIELLGTYDPIKGETKLNNELIMKQLKDGAQPTDTVRSMLRKDGIWAKFMAEKQANDSRKANLKKANNTTKKSKTK